VVESSRPWWRDIQDAERREVDDEEGGWIMHAVNGLLRGDLLPLAEYLRAGYPLSYMVRRDLVSAIEGDGFYRLELIKNRRGPGNALSELHASLRILKIGTYIEEQLPLLNDDVEAAVHAAMQEFDIKRTTAMNARKAHKIWMEKLADSAAEWKAQSSKNGK
jgi:hypothetical protein